MTPSAYGVGFGLALAILFLVHNQIVKTALLLSGGAVELETGTGKLAELGGLAARKPLQATIFFVAAFSLAGFPPSSGFIGKLGLLEVTFSSGQWVIAGVSLIVSLLTTMSMIRLWQYIFWGKPTATIACRCTSSNRRATGMLLAASADAGGAQPRHRHLQHSRRWTPCRLPPQAIDRAGYIEAVAPQ